MRVLPKAAVQPAFVPTSLVIKRTEAPKPQMLPRAVAAAAAKRPAVGPAVPAGKAPAAKKSKAGATDKALDDFLKEIDALGGGD